ncbi:MmcQ/YjbR family DNA-binding protein [Ramlibacter sp. WS9]|uniref:MmcQ/YjbR family DNA-binding protein n=1 Tax=Ramlibacter sp. WS9 TaxID=1882741 RepID=UPI0011446CA4|nr:MmcQ/YjbR family DNA-binding protein [Ramlibacter sp. WS9]ROZ64121.1 MmcQ/YjbR family DNA-binding protein [Ramlibacter sp. WS9]
MGVRLATVRKFALSLPEVGEEPHHDYASFRVRGKIFVTVPPGDEFVHVFVPEQIREQALAVHGAFLEKLFWGAKALGLKVRLAEADAEAVKLLVRQAWEHKAPKALVTDLPHP